MAAMSHPKVSSTGKVTNRPPSQSKGHVKGPSGPKSPTLAKADRRNGPVK
jgi:hypothetical protein